MRGSALFELVVGFDVDELRALTPGMPVSLRARASRWDGAAPLGYDAELLVRRRADNALMLAAVTGIEEYEGFEIPVARAVAVCTSRPEPACNRKLHAYALRFGVPGAAVEVAPELTATLATPGAPATPCATASRGSGPRAWAASARTSAPHHVLRDRETTRRVTRLAAVARRRARRRRAPRMGRPGARRGAPRVGPRRRGRRLPRRREDATGGHPQAAPRPLRRGGFAHHRGRGRAHAARVARLAAGARPRGTAPGRAHPHARGTLVWPHRRRVRARHRARGGPRRHHRRPRAPSAPTPASSPTAATRAAVPDAARAAHASTALALALRRA